MDLLNLEKLLDNSGKSKDYIEGVCGLPNYALTRWLRGGVPSSKNLSKLADYFNVSIDYLVGREKPEPDVELLRDPKVRWMAESYAKLDNRRKERALVYMQDALEFTEMSQEMKQEERTERLDNLASSSNKRKQM